MTGPVRLAPVALACLVALASCRPDVQTRPDAASPRVVSLVPSATEIVFALGMGDHLAGATRYCTRPAAARDVPRVGGILDISAEAVLAARPDVVIGSPSVLTGRLMDLLERTGAHTAPLSFEGPETVLGGIASIGALLGVPDRAEALAASVRADLDALRDRALRTPRVRVLFVVGRNPLVVAGGPSFLGDLLARMGVDNVAADASQPFPTWSLEQVLAADPDVVVDGAVEADDLDSAWRQAGVRAAATGRVLRLADDEVLRPGPAMAAAALSLADRIRASAGGAP